MKTLYKIVWALMFLACLTLFGNHFYKFLSDLMLRALGILLMGGVVFSSYYLVKVKKGRG